MMIDAAQALLLAYSAALQEGWGEIPLKKYTAGFFQFDGKPAWSVRRKEIVTGREFRFVIDAETGAILTKERLGFR